MKWQSFKCFIAFTLKDVLTEGTSLKFNTFVTGPVKTGNICTNYACSENDTFLDLCSRYSYSVNFACFLIDMSIRNKRFIIITCTT